MALIDDVTRLRGDILSSLDESHNYYVHTKYVWRLLQEMVRQGRQVTIDNQVTGTTVDGAELSSLTQGYVTGYLAAATFQHFVTLFEQFVFDLLRLWLTEHPGSLAGKELKFRMVLESPDKDAIVTAVVQKQLYGLAHERVANWFDYLESIAKLGCPSKEQIERLAEIKASRDVLVHNNGIVNMIYLDKSMGQARFAEGERLELPEHYHRDSWQLIKLVVNDVANAAISKLGG